MQGPEKLNNISFPEASMSRKEWRTQVHWGQNKCPCSSREILSPVPVRDNSFTGSSITSLNRTNLIQAKNVIKILLKIGPSIFHFLYKVLDHSVYFNRWNTVITCLWKWSYNAIYRKWSLKKGDVSFHKIEEGILGHSTRRSSLGKMKVGDLVSK